VDGLTDSVEEMLLLASPTSASVASGGTRPVERVEEKVLSLLDVSRRREGTHVLRLCRPARDGFR
jgi:hypothetical protein